MDFNNKLNRFCQKYAVKYYTTGRYVRHAVRTPFDPSGLAIEYQHTFKYDEEPIVALEMPESAVKSLVEFCEQMEKQHYNQYVLHMLERQEKDAQVRNRNRGVREAYERYQLLLELAR